jgi:aromatic ring hydroxylase
MVSMRPFVVFAIKVMGPGPRRVKMVRLAHAMTDGRSGSRHSLATLHVAGPRLPSQVAPSQRAA